MIRTRKGVRNALLGDTRKIGGSNSCWLSPGYRLASEHIFTLSIFHLEQRVLYPSQTDLCSFAGNRLSRSPNRTWRWMVKSVACRYLCIIDLLWLILGSGQRLRAFHRSSGGRWRYRPPTRLSAPGVQSLLLDFQVIFQWAEALFSYCTTGI